MDNVNLIENIKLINDKCDKTYVDSIVPIEKLITIIESTDIIKINDFDYWTSAQKENEFQYNLESIMELTIDGKKYSLGKGELIRGGNCYYINDDNGVSEHFPFHLYVYSDYIKINNSDWSAIQNLTNFKIYQIDYDNKIESGKINSVSYNKIIDTPNAIKLLENRRTIAIDREKYYDLFTNNLININDKDLNLSPFTSETLTDNRIFDSTEGNTSVKTTHFYINNIYNENDNHGKGFKINFYDVLGLSDGEKFDNVFIAWTSLLNCKITIVDPNLEIIKTFDLSSYSDYEHRIFDNSNKIKKGDYYILFAKTVDNFTAFDLNDLIIYTPDLDAKFGMKNYRKFISSDNKVKYEPVEDYNPATKKYVDEGLNSAKNCLSMVTNHINTTKNLYNFDTKESVFIYEWDSVKNKEVETTIEISKTQISYNGTYYKYLTLFIKDSSFKNMFDKNYIYTFVVNNDIILSGIVNDRTYYGINTMSYFLNGTINNNNVRLTDYGYLRSRIYYPRAYLPEVNYQMYYCDTFDLAGESIKIDMELYADTEEELLKYDNINNMKIFKTYYKEKTFTTNNKIDDTINYISNTYGYDYSLKFSTTVTLEEEHKINTDKNYKFFQFFKATNCIIDWGDGTIEKFTNVSTADHHFYPGKYKIKIYSDSYLWLSKIQYGHNIIDVLDLSQHTSLYRIFYNGSITLNCDVNVNSTITDVRYSFMAITNPDRLKFDNQQQQFNNITSLNNTFCGNVWISSLPTFIDYSKVTDFYCAFQCMTNLYNVNNLDTSGGENGESMFMDCANLQSVNELDCTNMTTINGMFTACHKLREVKLKNTGKCIDFGSAFQDCVCLESISELDISSLSLEKNNYNDNYAYINEYTFIRCKSLKYVKLVGNATKEQIEIFINCLPTYLIEGQDKQLDITGCINKDQVAVTKDTWTILK